MSSSKRKTIPAWKRNISTPHVSPKKGRRVRDKLELSPNNRAKCQRCGDTIRKGEERIGIQGKVQTPRGHEVWRLRYYHGGCVTEGTKRKLHLESPAVVSPAAASAAQSQSQSRSTKSTKQQSTLLPTRALKEMERDLRQLRRHFANILECQEYQIFQNKSLHEILEKLPTTVAELQQCWGIKEKRCSQYGDSILRVVNYYLQQQQKEKQQKQQKQQKHKAKIMANNSLRTPTTPPTHRHQNSKAAASQTSSSQMNPGSDDGDDIVVTGPSLSIENIVRQRVREAEARGEVLEIL